MSSISPLEDEGLLDLINCIELYNLIILKIGYIISYIVMIHLLLVADTTTLLA